MNTMELRSIRPDLMATREHKGAGWRAADSDFAVKLAEKRGLAFGRGGLRTPWDKDRADRAKAVQQRRMRGIQLSMLPIA